MSYSVSFEYTAEVGLTPEQLCEHILDLDRWKSFQGYGPLPGIVQAEFHKRTEEVVGTIIAITCADGSRHFEEIAEWTAPSGFWLKLHNFSEPLRSIATHFDEEWRMTRLETTTLVTRRFEMYPTRAAFRPLVWLISRLMRQAVAHQMKQIRQESQEELPSAE